MTRFILGIDTSCWNYFPFSNQRNIFNIINYAYSYANACDSSREVLLNSEVPKIHVYTESNKKYRDTSSDLFLWVYWTSL